MVNDGHLMDWMDDRHSHTAHEQQRLHQRVQAYLALT